MSANLCRFCGKREATEECPKGFPTLGICLCRHCHAVGRLAFPCPHFTLEEAKRIREEDHRAALCSCMSPAEIETWHEDQKKESPEMATAKKKETNGTGADHLVERARYTEKLPVKIEATEVQAHANELARVIHDREETLERKRSANAAYREKIAFFDERLTELAESVTGKTERRDVEVVEYLDTKTNEIRVVRTDTKEIVSTRTADAADLQEDMFSEGENPKSLDGEPPKKKRGRPRKNPEAQPGAEA